MKRLTKERKERLAGFVTGLQAVNMDIDEAYEELERAHEKFCETLDRFNEGLAEAVEFRDEIVGEMNDYADDKSEKWQDGDAGQSYREWINEWENCELSEVDKPDMPEKPSELEDRVAQLENLPDEPAGF